MKLLQIAILFILYTINLYGQDNRILCTLTTKSKVINVGEVPKLNVTFENCTDSTFYLITPLDASSDKWRYPYAYYTIELLGDTTYKPELVYRCGNMDGMDSLSFIKIESNHNCNLLEFTSRVYRDFSIHDSDNFKNKGHYRITYHYSTASNSLSDYFGRDMYMRVFRTKYFPKMYISESKLVVSERDQYKDELEVLDKLFSKVPKVELTSNSIIIEVK